MISQRGGKHEKLFERLFWIELVAFVIGIGLFVLTKGAAPLGEALPTAGFHAWILAVSSKAQFVKTPSFRDMPAINILPAKR